jgi:RimJ/RimL family protein N-acetyltransferase
MIRGGKISLRLIQETDIGILARLVAETENRGPYYPGSIQSLGELRSRFEKDGFWSKRDGRMVILGEGGRILGWIFFFRPHPVSEAYEVAYIIFDERSRNKGYGSEALALFVRFMFRTMPIHRIELNIATENLQSIRVAEKCHFVREGVARETWFSPAIGRYMDGARYSILRSEVEQDAPEGDPASMEFPPGGAANKGGSNGERHGFDGEDHESRV